MRTRRLGWFRAALAAAMLFVAAAPVAAQDTKDEPFYDVPVKTHQKPFIQWTVAVLFMVACLVIAFKNPHRTHLD